MALKLQSFKTKLCSLEYYFPLKMTSGSVVKEENHDFETKYA